MTNDLVYIFAKLSISLTLHFLIYKVGLFAHLKDLQWGLSWHRNRKCLAWDLPPLTCLNTGLLICRWWLHHEIVHETITEDKELGPASPYHEEHLVSLRLWVWGHPAFSELALKYHSIWHCLFYLSNLNQVPLLIGLPQGMAKKENTCIKMQKAERQ